MTCLCLLCVAERLRRRSIIAICDEDQMLIRSLALLPWQVLLNNVDIKSAAGAMFLKHNVRAVLAIVDCPSR